MSNKKDPKKVKAGRKGGKLSPTNFKNNKALARLAGRRSARKRALANLPSLEEASAPYIPTGDEHGNTKN